MGVSSLQDYHLFQSRQLEDEKFTTLYRVQLTRHYTNNTNHTLNTIKCFPTNVQGTFRKF